MPNPYGWGQNEPQIKPKDQGGDTIATFSQKIYNLFDNLFNTLNSYPWSTATQSDAGYMSATDKTALDNVASTYLPLSGGTLTGVLLGANGLRLTANDSAHESRLCGGTSLTDGATIIAYGKDNASGMWRIRAYGDHDLVGKPDGTLTWDGKNVATIQTGNWTPALYFISPNAGNVTYLTQSGTYTLIGDLVHIYGTLSFKINTVPSNYVIMSGLPFAASGTARFALSPNRWLRTQGASTQTYLQKVRTDVGALTELFWSTNEGTTNYKVAVGDTITWEFSGWYRK